MRSNYKKLGRYIRPVDERNRDLAITNLQGVSIAKEFVSSIANIIGTDLSTYKIVRTGQFAYGPVTSRNGDKISIALLKGEDCIISSSYVPFEVYKPDELLPEYLMLWFMRPEFDRYARFMSNGSAREVFDWDSMCGVELPVPSIPEQRKIVHDYQVITDRIELLRKINENLEQQAQALFKSWFVEFEPFNGTMPSDWEIVPLEKIADFQNGYAFKSKELLNEPSPDCYQVFKQGHIARGGGFIPDGTKSWYPKSIASKLEKFVLKKGDILMAMTDMKDNVAILGNTAVMPLDNEYIVNQRVGRLRANGYKGVTYPFIYLLTNSTDFLVDLRSRANSGVQVNLSSSEIKASQTVLPSEEVNNAFSEITLPMFEFIINNQVENQRLAQLRDTLLPKLMSGELDVSDIDL